MENQMQIFNNPQFGEIRTIENGLKNTYFGVVYALEYGDMVKIGSSAKPYTRIMALSHQANDYAEMPIGRCLLSSPHTNFRKNEIKIHNLFSVYRKDDTELFNVSLEMVAKAMNEIELRDETEQIRANGEIFLSGMKNFIAGGTDTLCFSKIETPAKGINIMNVSNVHGYSDANNNIWLNAEDVAIGLGFTQNKNGVTYVKWERVNSYLSEFGFSPRVGKGDYIPENMVYRLGFKANNETAIRFQAILADEVLPAIRKTGSYSIANLSRKELAMMVIQAEEEKERLMLENKQQAALIEEQKPKTVFADAIVGSKSSCLIGELAKIISQNGHKIGQNRLFVWLRQNHYLGTHGEYYNIPNQKYIEQGLFEIKKTTHSENGVMKTTSTPKVTGKGQQYFINLFLRQDRNLFGGAMV